MTAIKIKKVRYCQECDFFNFTRGKKYHRYRCHNPDSLRKNGNYRMINKGRASKGEIPGWCSLEDYPA